MDITVLYPVGAAVVRGVAGWAENAFEDGKVSRFELTQLAATVLRIGTMTFAAAYGLDMDVTMATALATGTDYLATWADSALRKKA